MWNLTNIQYSRQNRSKYKLVRGKTPRNERMEVACSGLSPQDFSSLPRRGGVPKRLMTTMMPCTRPSTESSDFVRCRIATSSSELKKNKQTNKQTNKKTEKYAGRAKYPYLKKEKMRLHKASMRSQNTRKSYHRVVWLCVWLL